MRMQRENQMKKEHRCAVDNGSRKWERSHPEHQTDDMRETGD